MEEVQTTTADLLNYLFDIRHLGVISIFEVLHGEARCRWDCERVLAIQQYVLRGRLNLLSEGSARAQVLTCLIEHTALEETKIDRELTGDQLIFAITEASDRASYHVYCQEPIGLSGKPFAFSKADEEWLGKLSDGLTLPCFDFCFIRLQEERIKPFLGGNLPKELHENPAKFLTGWGYKLVEEPKEGDLAVYTGAKDLMAKYGIDKSVGILQHMGLMTKGGKIQSKWGPTGWVIVHGLDEVPVQYGKCTHFFRPAVEL